MPVMANQSITLPHPIFISSDPMNNVIDADVDIMTASWTPRPESWYPIDTAEFKFNLVSALSFSLAGSVYTAAYDNGFFPGELYTVYVQAATIHGYKAITKITVTTRGGLGDGTTQVAEIFRPGVLFNSSVASILKDVGGYINGIGEINKDVGGYFNGIGNINRDVGGRFDCKADITGLLYPSLNDTVIFSVLGALNGTTAFMHVNPNWVFATVGLINLNTMSFEDAGPGDTAVMRLTIKKDFADLLGLVTAGLGIYNSSEFLNTEEIDGYLKPVMGVLVSERIGSNGIFIGPRLSLEIVKDLKNFALFSHGIGIEIIEIILNAKQISGSNSGIIVLVDIIDEILDEAR